MNIWLKRRLSYINDYMGDKLQPDKVKRFYSGDYPFYRHTMDYYTHIMFFFSLSIIDNDDFTPLTKEREKIVFDYVRNNYEEKIKELIKQYGY